VWSAETAGSVDVSLLEKGVISRVPKSRARNKRWLREGLYTTVIEWLLYRKKCERGCKARMKI